MLVGRAVGWCVLGLFVLGLALYVLEPAWLVPLVSAGGYLSFWVFGACLVAALCAVELIGKRHPAPLSTSGEPIPVDPAPSPRTWHDYVFIACMCAIWPSGDALNNLLTKTLADRIVGVEFRVLQVVVWIGVYAVFITAAALLAHLKLKRNLRVTA